MNAYTRHRVSRLSAAPLMAASVLALAACDPAGEGQGDTAQINRALLGVLTGNGKRICIDRATHGEPLAVFRSMLPAPDPARRPLVWSVPKPLEDGRVITNRELVDVELGHGQVRLPEKNQNVGVLPPTEQIQLNALAREGSLMTADSGARLSPSPQAPRAEVRWWVKNRLDKSCGPIYTISKPVLLHGSAFVSVTAGHHGATYAFRQAGGTWSPYAKWTTWLY